MQARVSPHYCGIPFPYALHVGLAHVVCVAQLAIEAGLVHVGPVEGIVFGSIYLKYPVPVSKVGPIVAQSRKSVLLPLQFKQSDLCLPGGLQKRSGWLEPVFGDCSLRRSRSTFFHPFARCHWIHGANNPLFSPPPPPPPPPK